MDRRRTQWHRLRGMDWDAGAGVTAAVLALVLHLLHVVEQTALLARHRGSRRCELKETVSFILTETEPDGVMEAHVSFWGEPFMSRVTGREIPRYIFHVQGHSELIGRLVELERHYRRS